MMQSSDQMTAPPQLNPFHPAEPQQSSDPLTASTGGYTYTRSPSSSAAQSSYSSLPTVDQLEFQNIAHTGGSGGAVNLDINDTTPINNAAADSSIPTQSGPFWTMNYYKPYCAMTTSTISARLYRSIAPWTGDLFSDDPQPDLYGPWWIATTLILTVAITANLSSYVYTHRNTDSDSDEKWHFKFWIISVTTSLVYSIISWIAVIVYYLLARAGQSMPLITIITVLGYSLTPLLFTSILLLVPVNILQWVVVSVGAAVQSLYIAKNLWVDRANAKVSPIVMGMIGGYVGIALLFKWWLFNNPTI